MARSKPYRSSIIPPAPLLAHVKAIAERRGMSISETIRFDRRRAHGRGGKAEKGDEIDQMIAEEGRNKFTVIKGGKSEGASPGTGQPEKNAFTRRKPKKAK